jgi:hypothetical protein
MREFSLHSPPRLEIETMRIEQSFYRSWFAPFSTPRILGNIIMDHAWIDKRWRTLEHWLFENLDCLRTLLLLFNLASRVGSMLREHGDWRKETKSTSDHKTRFLWRKGRLVKYFRNFFVRKTFFVGTSETILLTLYLTCEFGCYWLVTLWCNDFKSRCGAHAYEDTMHLFMRYGANDAG